MTSYELVLYVSKQNRSEQVTASASRPSNNRVPSNNNRWPWKWHSLCIKHIKMKHWTGVEYRHEDSAKSLRSLRSVDPRLLDFPPNMGQIFSFTLLWWRHTFRNRPSEQTNLWRVEGGAVPRVGNHWPVHNSSESEMKWFRHLNNLLQRELFWSKPLLFISNNHKENEKVTLEMKNLLT